MSIKRALLVGINYPGTRSELRGCVNDVKIMNDIITKHYGFTDPSNKRMLTDSSATTQNIMDRLEWLVDGAQPGDVLFFHYSGHGSQMVDTQYDNDYEPDGYDEILCPIDLNWRDKVIKDDDLKRVFDKVPEGVNLTVVLDCCHSGGGMDSAFQYQPDLGGRRIMLDPNSPNRERLLPIPEDIANRGFGLDLKPRERKLQSTNVAKSSGLMISGCQSHQTSADAYIHNMYVGACTYFLADTLKKHRYDVDYTTIVDAMNKKLSRHNYDQRPELNGSKELFKRKFLQPFK